MQVVNISHKIDEANNLILELKPVLQTYGTFQYDILGKGKDTPTFIIRISFVKTNTWTSVLVNIIQKITSKGFYFILDPIEGETKITLNIVI
jgi:hypothetical protein